MSKKQVEDMVNHGAAIIVDPVLPPMPLAMVRWAAGHMHYALLGGIDHTALRRVAYDRIAIPHSLGAEFYKDDQLVAYVAPFAEWVFQPPWTEDMLAYEWGRRQRAVADPATLAAFIDYWDENL